MERQTSLQVNRLIVCLCLLLAVGCSSNSLVDVNLEIPENNWTYAKNVKAVIEVKDSSVAYNLAFKMRNTSDYRYSNIYILMRLKGTSLSKSTRYQFQLANGDGQWLGKGSGDLYSNTFYLLKNFRFPSKGKYELAIEQNMRDNPLLGISDVGLTVAPAN